MRKSGAIMRMLWRVVAEALERQARKFAYVAEKPTATPDEWDAA